MFHPVKKKQRQRGEVVRTSAPYSSLKSGGPACFSRLNEILNLKLKGFQGKGDIDKEEYGGKHNGGNT